jgi:hypothetical protein
VNATQVYPLKKEIDAALRQYGASAVAWKTQWSELRIVKYNHMYGPDRSVIYQEYIASEDEWKQRRASIEQELATIPSLVQFPESTQHPEHCLCDGCASIRYAMTGEGD